ncbi:MAG: HEAT repeat domain-containing protein [Chloroflexi bacterium]|nr:HEAT repeat domain-containing protein [Chloroflexota bacterium]
MRETAVLPDLLELRREPDRQVQWALVWAVGHIGIINPVVIDFLLTASTWENGRARMEVAHAIGFNRFEQLNYLLHQLLYDPDLRVVERAVWSLGMLQDTSAVTVLSAILNKAKHGSNRNSRKYYHRVEEFLEQTLTIALVRIKQGVDVKTVPEDTPERLCYLFRLDASQKMSHTFPVEIQPLLPLFTEKEMEQQVTQIETLTDKEQILQIYNANIPLARLKAIESSVAKTGPLPDDIRQVRHGNLSEAQSDPAIAVRVLARQLLKYQSQPNFRFSLRYIPESLAAARKRIQEQDDIYLDFPELEVENWPSLQLAHFFTDWYEVTELQNALLSQYPWQSLHKEEFSFLGDTLPKERLSQLTLLWCQYSKNPGYHEDWGRNDFFAPLNSLARRRKWNIVPDLTQILSGETKKALSAAHSLIEMGVYQAAILIDKAMQTSIKVGGSQAVEESLRTYLRAITRVELLGATTNIIQREFLLEKEQYDQNDKVLYEDWIDLLCEVDGHHLQWSGLWCMG